jgi:hypothetical protein
MADEMATGGEAASEAANPQAGVTEAGQTAAPSNTGGGATPREYRLGDTTYKGEDELYKGAQRWQGEFTRVSQERSNLQRENAGLRAVFDVVKSDPRLQQEVLQRIRAGQSPQQAVKDTAQAHPEVLQQMHSLKSEVQELRQARLVDEQDRAQYEFRDKHKDINDKEWHSMAEYIGANAEWLQRANLTPQQMIELSYNSTVLPQRLSMAHAAGQQAKEDEIRKGQGSRLMGSQAASSSARATSNERPKGKLTPAQERAYAGKVFAANKRG